MDHKTTVMKKKNKGLPPPPPTSPLPRRIKEGGGFFETGFRAKEDSKDIAVLKHFEERTSIAMPTLEGLKTWDDLQIYLLERMEYATEKKSKTNKSFTKCQMWNFYSRQCLNAKGQDISIVIRKILIKNIKRDFGMKISNR